MMEKINLIGVYDDEDIVVNAIYKIKESGIKIKNVFMPFPVHGVFEALNLKTRLPLLTFIYSVIGAILSFSFLYWTSVVSYPLKFGGKPLNSLSFIIILFVTVILVGVLMTVITFFIRQRLGPGQESVMIDTRTIDDKFVIVIDKDPGLSSQEVNKINKLFNETGAIEVKEQPEPENYSLEHD